MQKHIEPRPTISIIVITYNRSLLLERCLASLAEVILTLKDFSLEVIVADNFSSDDTEKVCKAWQDKFENSFPIRVLRHSKNLGANPSFFAALRFARGRYTFFMGDDDGLVVGSFQKLLEDVLSGEPFSVGVEGDFLSARGSPVYLTYQELLRNQRHFFKAGSFFYKVGNGYCGIYNVDELRKILQDPKNPCAYFETSNWGQSSLAGLLASESSLPVAVLSPGYGEVVLKRPFAQGGLSIAASLEGMIDAVTNLGRYDESSKACLAGLMRSLNSPVNTHLYILLGTTPRSIGTQVSGLVRRVRRKLVTSRVEMPLLTRILFTLVSLPLLRVLITKTKMTIHGVDVGSAKYNESHY